MIIGIRKFFRTHWKKLCCSFALFGCVFGVSFAALKPKAMEISTENYLSDGEQDFTTYSLLFSIDYNRLNYTNNSEIGYWDDEHNFIDDVFNFQLSSTNSVIGIIDIFDDSFSSTYINCYFQFFNTTYTSNIISLPINKNIDYYVVSTREQVFQSDGNISYYYNFWLCSVSELVPIRNQNTQLQNQNSQLQNQINEKDIEIELLEDRVGDYQRDNILLQNQIDEMQRDNEDIFNVAYNKGFEEGFDSGETSGFQSGKTETINDDYNGLTYNDIKSLGFEEGKSWQLSNGGSLDNLVFVFVNSMFSSPINILKSYLNWDFFGINLFSLLTSLITLMLVFWVIRFFIGKK